MRNWFGKFFRGKAFSAIFFALCLGLVLYLTSRPVLISTSSIALQKAGRDEYQPVFSMMLAEDDLAAPPHLPSEAGQPHNPNRRFSEYARLRVIPGKGIIHQT